MIISAASTSILIIGLHWQWRFLAGVEHFRYPYREWLGFQRFLIPFLFALLILLFFIWGFRKGCRLRYILFLTVLAYFFQLSISAAGPYGLTSIGLIVSDPSITSYFEPVAEMESLPLAQYPDLMETFFMHARTHPPGPILFMKWILNIFEKFPLATSFIVELLLFLGVSPAIFELNPHTHIATFFAVGFLLPLLGSLSAIPIYCFVRQIDDKNSAFIASTLFLITPAISIFLPEFDQFYALFTAIAFTTGWYSLMNNRAFYAFISGLTIFAATFFQLLCLSLIPLLFLSFLLLVWRKLVTIDRKGTFKIFFAFIAGFASPFLFLKIVYGFSIIKVFKKVLLLSQVLLEKAPPPGLDILHFAIFSGISTFILLLFALFSKESFVPAKMNVQKILTLSFFALIIALSALGYVRAETGRLWIFLMPLSSCIAGIELQRLSKNRPTVPLIVFLLIILTLFVIRGKLAVLNTPIYGNF